MTDLSGCPGGGTPLGRGLERIKHRWAWFVALGLVSILLGVLALVLVVSATIASVFLIAVFMIVIGGTEIALGLAARTWGRFFLWIIAGLFYVAGGAFAIAQPLAAAAVLTLMLGTALLASGIVRLVIGSHMGPGARTPTIVAGIVTALVGLLVLVGWPANSVVILGTLLGLDLVFSGTSRLLFGLRLRRHA